MNAQRGTMSFPFFKKKATKTPNIEKRNIETYSDDDFDEDDENNKKIKPTKKGKDGKTKK